MRKKKSILGFAFLILFVVDTILVCTNNIGWFDSFVYDLIPRGELLTKIMKAITLIGEDITVVGFSVAALIFIKDKNKAVFVPVAAASISILNLILKHIIRRVRPVGIALITQGGFSFPSGHSVTAIVFYGFIMSLVLSSKRSRNEKVIISSLLGIIIFSIGISRIYLGVHFASDVLGGFLLGGAFLVMYTELYNRYLEKQSK